MFISAASRLVRAGGNLYVVANDELHLCVLTLVTSRTPRSLCVLDGELPLTAKARKASKGASQVLNAAASVHRRRAGSLLALGSDS